ncbi:histidinol-phosphate transaminase [Paracraurococcus lichenis]|uniref:Histidinol-phosphate aminotransferase n=1 Tax=Paracraurococcus lichenis TaxID=3064888 RepID=A0ABT9DYU7_9PROT|nr:histidinol-phosphate transaminase [Paracraurococcus sp. LOR1-02]MDO9709087.1 histidinol-phosphate transaminase [Paracraurococcus sp. LOR1-02]
MPALLPRPSILSIEPYVGGESKIPGVNRIVKLSSNEGAFGVPPGAQQAYAAMAAELHRYPDGGATALREAIGRRFGLDPARIVCGNGSDELIGALVMAYGGEGTELVMSAHGFIMYDIAGRYAGCRVIKVPERNLTADVDAMLAAVGPRTRLVFLANPNNPTGSMLPAAEVARLRAGLREDVLLVLDSAYAEYVTRPDYDPGTALVDAGGNTVMTRTFSKVFGLGGVRLGWAYAPAHVIDILNRVRGPFNVNAPAMAAGIAALAEPGWVEKSVAHNDAWRAKLSEGLRALGIAVHPSEGNFILADFGTAERAKAADAALKARGLIVRAMAAYSLPQALRITIGTAEECGMVQDALAGFMRGA